MKVSTKNDPLVAIAGVPFESFRSKLKAALSTRIKDGATTSGCSRRQKFICILKRKPLSTAAIKACRERTPTRRCRRNAAKRIRYPQSTRPETALSPANACLARTSSPCSNASRLSLTATEIAAADSACASSSSPQSTISNSQPHKGYARGPLSSTVGRPADLPLP
jgi:hypothetical protein